MASPTGAGQRPPTRLFALGGNRFAFDDDPVYRLDFHVTGGRATAFEINPAGAASQGRYDRTR